LANGPPLGVRATREHPQYRQACCCQRKSSNTQPENYTLASVLVCAALAPAISHRHLHVIVIFLLNIFDLTAGSMWAQSDNGVRFAFADIISLGFSNQFTN
jgi:hypothetical protein